MSTRICKIYEVGEHEGQPYIVMQYIDGHPLSVVLQQNAAPSLAMSREEKVRVIFHVAEALHTAHRLGLIHRDIKPGKDTRQGGIAAPVRTPSVNVRTVITACA